MSLIEELIDQYDREEPAGYEKQWEAEERKEQIAAWLREFMKRKGSI